MVTPIGRLLQELRVGARTLDSAAEEVRRMAWPSDRSPQAFSGDLAAFEGYGDFPLPGSFEEVTAAYMRGYLTEIQYRRLSEAASGE